MNTEIQNSTHTVRTDAVNKDASVKRIELDFCKTDHWTECWPGMMNIAEMLQYGINRMISNDDDSVGSQQTIIDKKMCKAIETAIFLPMIIKPEYIVSK